MTRKARGMLMLPALCTWVNLVAALAFGVCCARSEPEGRVLILGIDGATFQAIDPLIEQDRVPHLAALAAQGVRAPLESLMPLWSPRIWNSLATGKKPEDHGIEGFARPDAAGRWQLYGSTDRRARSLWTIATEAGRTVGVVNWWNTFPVQKLRGVMVADHLFAGAVQRRRELTGAALPPRGPLIYPPEWAARLHALLDNVDRTDLPNPLRDVAGMPDWLDPGLLAKWYHQDVAVARLALAIEEGTRADLLMVLLTGVDRMSHSLWMGMEPPDRYPEKPEASAGERRAMRDALESYYEFIDSVVGRFLERYQEDDLVIVASDHGFEAGLSASGLTGVHDSEAARDGILLARGPGLDRAWRGRVSVLDIAPLVLAWMGLPVAEDLAGHVPEFLAVGDVERIASYDHLEREFLDAADSGEEAALLEQLESLGYLE